MIEDGNPESATNQVADVSRFGLFGDFPTRAIFRILRATPRLPRFLETGLLHFFTFFVFLTAHSQRNAIRKNLSVIWTDLSWAEGHLGAYRVLVNFGWTYIDGIRTRLGQKVITWEIDGLEWFEKIRDAPGSAIILTTHTGNYDLAAALFSPKFGRDLHTVRAPERSPFLQEIRRKELEADANRYKHFKVHYNTSESMLGIELARLLSEGELVAIQSDRVVAGVAAIKVPVPGGDALMRVPRGPMTLATIARCPCFPLHVVRDGYRHYRIIFHAPLDPTSAAGANRLREPDFARAWVEVLLRFLQLHALQWFVFEEAFEEDFVK